MAVAYPPNLQGMIKRSKETELRSGVSICKRSFEAVKKLRVVQNNCYENGIRQKIEVEENIGKMIIIDIETGDYEVDKMGLQASRNLSKKHPNARLFGIRIGYNVAVSFGGVMERVDK